MGTNTNTITLNLNLKLKLSPTRPKSKILCKNNSAFEENKQVSVDYDEGKHQVSTRLTGLRKADIQRRYRLRVQADRFQRDWTLSEVVHEILSLRPHDDIEGVLNRWVGRFARKNFPLLIREITQRGSIERSIQVFQWMKNQKNYCPRNDIYNMMIRLHARHNWTDQAHGLFFEMQEWSHSQADRFQRDWTLSEVVHEILRLRPHDDVEGLLNHWIGHFARKNFPLLIRALANSS